MSAMNRKSRRVPWQTRVTIPTDAAVHSALTMVRERLRRSGRILFRGEKLTQEAVFGALCLWADAHGDEALESELGPFIAQLEAIVAARKEIPDPHGGEVGDARDIVKNNPPVRGKRGGQGPSDLEAYRRGEAI